MNFAECFKTNDRILMEGALGERLKREYGLTFDENVALAGLVYSEAGRNALRILWNQYADIACKYHMPFIATTPTRRANPERISKSHFSDTIIKDNADFLRDVQKNCRCQMYIGGLMGCKGDAYTGEGALSETEAYEFHMWQAQQFMSRGIDFVYAGIMPVLSEAVGMAKAMESTGIPYIISFTIQADGKLIDGTTITDAIIKIDNATEHKPLCYMTNCVHPKIVYEALMQPFNTNETIKQRFLGIQGNTSPLSYAELDNAKDLKSSEPEQFAQETVKLSTAFPIKIFGGCCGTDDRHMECIAKLICK